jgi:hypothetical protein
MRRFDAAVSPRKRVLYAGALSRWASLGLLAAGLGLTAACATVSPGPEPTDSPAAGMAPVSMSLDEEDKGSAAIPEEKISLEERWGVRVSSVRLTAAGYMLDFRYTIVDPEKAAPLSDPKNKPVLIDQASGAEMMVPAPPKVGSLRSKSRNGLPVAGRSYFVLFANPGGYIKTGNKVTVAIGDFRAEDLTAE